VARPGNASDALGMALDFRMNNIIASRREIG
jgi:hypothetical protein